MIMTDSYEKNIIECYHCGVEFDESDGESNGCGMMFCSHDCHVRRESEIDQLNEDYNSDELDYYSDLNNNDLLED
jgi:hypothetical protein